MRKKLDRVKRSDYQIVEELRSISLNTWTLLVCMITLIVVMIASMYRVI